MISATSVAEHLTRVQAQEKLDNFLKRTDVREQLMAYGLSAEEASKRMASLSELELRQLAGQVEEARAGGDILIAVLVVVLIIFLIKRI
ncbi:MAG: PA2779 family protein [Bdellovibrionales bacterium]